MARGRNASGEGTIYKRRDGRWEGAIYLTTTAGIKTRRRVYGRTRAEVYTKLTQEKARAEQGLLVSDQNWSLGAYLDHWLENVVRRTKRPSTCALYESVIRLYLKPGLGRRQLSRLSVPMVQAYLNGRLEAGDSVHMVYKIRTVLSAALTSAVREELLIRNVARLVVLPPWPHKEQQSWSAEEVRTFLRAAESHPLYPAFLLLLTYGLRRGEVLGLRWSDISAEDNTIYVRQQLQRVGQQLILGPLKTPASRRNLPLLRTVREVLEDHFKRQSHRPIANDLVFTTSTGRPIEPRSFVRSFQRLCVAADVRQIRVHDLRRTVASLLNKLGVSARDAQVILGHSRLAVTLEIYTNVDRESRAIALDQVQGLLAGDR
ncbi:site-specific integrase [Streptosporangiaceae bacterium NEAU-GS5]|nr:site-specific integrase [Streptosporangiaceae bacterium NEAU-GS5]